MDFKSNAPSRELQSWLKFCYSPVKRAEAAVILGLHSAAQIQILLDFCPKSSFTIVDPEIEQINRIVPEIRGSLTYVTNQSGVLLTQKLLREAARPIPILCYRPRWIFDRLFFETAHRNLVEAEAIKVWQGQNEDFILRGLFR